LQQQSLLFNNKEWQMMVLRILPLHLAGQNNVSKTQLQKQNVAKTRTCR